MGKYRMYIDEVGNPNLDAAEKHFEERFLCLTGVVIELQYVRDILKPDMERLKKRFFEHYIDPDEPIILHRKDLINANHPFEILRNKEIRTEFDKYLLALMSKWEYTVISVVIDKLEHKNKYKVWRYDPYHYCLAVLIERFIFFLDREDSVGDVLAESRGGKEDRRLKESFRRLYAHGTDFLDPKRFGERLTSCQIKIKPKSSNISGLQLTDLIAHPCRQKILVDNGLLQSSKIARFAEKILGILESKFYKDPVRGVIGYGRKLLP